jgi:hypothetical protein
MSVGAIEETVTVTGQAPLVDVQGTASETVITKELLEAVPNQRMVQRFTVFIPGVVANPLGTSRGLSTDSGVLAIHGGRSGEANVMLDGVSTRNMNGVGGQTAVRYMINQAMVQEVAVSIGSAGADQQLGGIMQNVIPRQGGNTITGLTYFHYTNERFSGDNLSQALKDRGLGGAGAIRESWDINPAVGGPIIRDRLWFYGSYRHWGNEVDAGIRYNLTPTGFQYTPDLSRPTAAFRLSDRNNTLRLTLQATPRNQFNLFFDHNPRNWYNRSASAQVSPESATRTPYYPNYVGQLTWKSPLTNRLFLEANVTYQNSNNLLFPNTDEGIFLSPIPADPAGLIGATELSTTTHFRSATGGSGSSVFGNLSTSKPLRSAAAASYVTGTHTMKVGVDFYNGERYTVSWRTGDMTYQLRNGVPNSIVLAAPNVTMNKLKADLGLYVQDRWVVGRLTANAGLRYDYLNAYVPAQSVPGNRWVGPREFAPVTGVPLWHDLSPRLGASYNLFGDGKTAIKATLNRYVIGEATGIANSNNPVVTSVLTATRTWNDLAFAAGDPRRGNFVPDCDFTNLDANQECGSISDRNFGQSNPRATQFDPEVLKGFGKRGYNWETSAQLQHQLHERLSVTTGYYRRTYGGDTAAQNIALGPDPSVHYDQYCVTLPSDSRLPDGGGNRVCGFYDIRAAMRGVVQNFVTHASHFGERREVYNGVDVTLSARLPNGGQVSGGSSTGRTALNTCYVVNSPQDMLFCDQKPPFQTQLKFMGVYPLPWYGVQVSGAFQSVPGPEIATTYVATNAEIQPSLGRALSAGATATVTLPVTPAGSLYEKRWNQFDFRASKIFRVGDIRLLGSLDVFNLFNSDGVLGVNSGYGPLYRTPTAILSPRLFRFAAQVDF